MKKLVQTILIISTFLTYLNYAKNYLPEHIINMRKEMKFEESVLYKKIYDTESRIYDNIIQYKKNKQKIKNNFPNYNEIKSQLKNAFSEILLLDEIDTELDNFIQIIIQKQSLTEEQQINFFEKIYNTILINYINPKFLDQKTKTLALALYAIKIINRAEKMAARELSHKLSMINLETCLLKAAKEIANMINNKNDKYKTIKEIAKNTFKNNYASIKISIKQAINTTINSPDIKHEFNHFDHILFITPQPQSLRQTSYCKGIEKIYDKFYEIIENFIPETLNIYYINNEIIINDLITQMIDYKIITYVYQEYIKDIEVSLREKQIHKS